MSRKLLVIAFISLNIIVFGQDVNPYDTLLDGNITIYTFNTNRLIIAEVPEISQYIINRTRENEDMRVKTVQEKSEEFQFRYAINGAYFTREGSSYGHAGYVLMNGMKISDYLEDRQLPHIFYYNKQYKRAGVMSIEEYKKSPPNNTLAFQTGPAIILDNQVAANWINSSKNGRGRHARTAIGILDNSRIFFISVIESMTLFELADILLAFPVFKNQKLDVINLDGGSSTACYSKKYSQVNYNVNFALPVILGSR